MASTNPSVQKTERRELLEYLAELPDIQPLEAVGYYRKAYKDSVSFGKSVQEWNNAQAAAEIEQLVQEVFPNA